MSNAQRQRLLDAIELAKDSTELELAEAKLKAFDAATTGANA